MDQQRQRSPNLHDAVRNGDEASVRLLLSSGRDANARDEYGRTPLLCADFAEPASPGILRMLLEAGAVVDSRDHDKQNALHLAVCDESLECVRILLEAGINVNLADCRLETPVYLAVKYRLPAIINALVQYKARVNYRDYKICKEHKPLARFLKKHRAIVSYLRREDILNALECVCLMSNVEFSRYLEKNIANINKLDTSGYSLLHLAVYRGNPKHVRYLLERGADASLKAEPEQADTFKYPMNLAVFGRARDKLEIVKLLLESNATSFVAEKNVSGQTPLHLMADSISFPNKVEIARVFIERGADLAARDEIEQTPLHAAMCYGRNNYLFIKLLLETVARANDGDASTYASIKDLFGRTPLQMALRRANLDVVKLLIAHAADGGALDRQNSETLGLAVENLNVDVIEYVIDQGFDPNDLIPSPNGFAPLHLAVINGEARACKALLERGASVNCKNIKDKTPLELACRRRDNEDVIRTLLEYGVGVNVSRQILINPVYVINRNVILRHIAKLKLKNAEINQNVLNTINACASLAKYVEECLSELKNLQTIRLCENISLLDILLADDRTLRGYVRNEKLVEEFDLVKSLYTKRTADVYTRRYRVFEYFEELNDKMRYEIARQTSHNRVAAFLHEVLGFNESFHTIIRKIMSYLCIGHINLISSSLWELNIIV